jgi:FkbM family methyltransferase
MIKYFDAEYLKLQIRKILNLSRYKFRKIDINTSQSVRLTKVIELYEIGLIFDIGANTGQFGREIRADGYQGKIVSFEPLSSAYKKLCVRASHDVNWAIGDQMAIGNYDGEIDINISNNSVSSSILPMLSKHTDSSPDSIYINSETVRISKLDSVSDQYIDPDINFLIKIDTQGFEWFVIEGAASTIKRSSGLLIELSTAKLYEGSKLWVDIIEKISEYGFTLWSLEPVFVEKETGRVLQYDGLFVRK